MGSNKTDVVAGAAGTTITVPSIGRIVHYVNSEGLHFAADVVDVRPSDSLAMLYVKNPQLRVAEFIDAVPEDQIGKLPHSWHWPERN